MSLSELAERCEAATGPDRGLDAEIGGLCGRTIPFHKLAHGKLAMQPEWIGGASSAGYFLPFYTASIDAAQMLVPEGFWWTVGMDTDYAWASLTPWGGYPLDPLHAEANNCRSPSLALCAAALRARAALASADTRPKGGDSTKIEAPFTSGAIPKGDAHV